MITQGTDIWYRMSKIKEMTLKQADEILSFRRFTKQKLIDVHGVEPSNIEYSITLWIHILRYRKIFKKPMRLVGNLGIEGINLIGLGIEYLN